MGIISEEQLRKDSLYRTAKKMLTAARTAPKGKGTDNLEIALVERDVIEKIADKMKDMVHSQGFPEFFIRDSNNILLTEVLVLIGTRISPLNLQKCGFCGFEDCAELSGNENVPCIFNPLDLGIAIGSAVTVAAEEKVDNRIMFSVGKAAVEMKLLGEDVKIAFAIPLSIGPKNPFFDRK